MFLLFCSSCACKERGDGWDWMCGKELLGNQRGDNQKKNLFELRHEFDHLATWMGFWSEFVRQFLEPFHRRMNCQRHGRTSTTLPRSKRQSNLHLRQVLVLNTLNTYSRLGNSIKLYPTIGFKTATMSNRLWAIVYSTCNISESRTLISLRPTIIMSKATPWMSVWMRRDAALPTLLLAILLLLPGNRNSTPL